MAQQISIPRTIDNLCCKSWAVKAQHHLMPQPELEATSHLERVNMVSSRPALVLDLTLNTSRTPGCVIRNRRLLNTDSHGLTGLDVQAFNCPQCQPQLQHLPCPFGPSELKPRQLQAWTSFQKCLHGPSTNASSDPCLLETTLLLLCTIHPQARASTVPKQANLRRHPWPAYPVYKICPLLVKRAANMQTFNISPAFHRLG